MRRWRRSSAVAGVLLALLPAAAAAQSAGDNQYADPFANNQKPSAPPSANAQPAQAPATPAPAPAAAAPAPAATEAAASARGAQLPRTGWDLALPAAGGLILLSAGAVLRVRVRRDA